MRSAFGKDSSRFLIGEPFEDRITRICFELNRYTKRDIEAVSRVAFVNAMSLADKCTVAETEMAAIYTTTEEGSTDIVVVKLRGKNET